MCCACHLAGTYVLCLSLGWDVCAVLVTWLGRMCCACHLAGTYVLCLSLGPSYTPLIFYFISLLLALSNFNLLLFLVFISCISVSLIYFSTSHTFPGYVLITRFSDFPRLLLVQLLPVSPLLISLLSLCPVFHFYLYIYKSFTCNSTDLLCFPLHCPSPFPPVHCTQK